MAKEIIKIPPAKSLIKGLRCIGYSFSTALADIIDNSISAQAKNIYILSNPDDDDPYIAIFDDGYGMNKSELDNAMTLGSNRDNKENSELELGRFGLGLKSASFSQCLKLTVVSKQQNEINAMRYDLIKIEEVNEWIIDVLNDSDIKKIPEIEHIFNSQSGTLVIWQSFDKISEGARSFRNSFISIVDLAKKHIEFVFHRFYSVTNIEFNGHKIEKRDPFLIGTPGIQEGRTQEIEVDGSSIIVTPFVLPFSNALTTEQKELLGNPQNIYDEQGFYIYRNKRLIVWGSWLYMNIKTEFNKLARVRVDISAELDSLWVLDVKKSSAKIPDKIKEQLRVSLVDSITRSKKELKYTGKKEQEAKSPLWRRVDMHQGKVKYEINRDDNPMYNQLMIILDNQQKKLLNLYLDKIEQYIPKGLIISDNADSITILNSDEKDEEDRLVEDLIFISKLTKDPISCASSLLDSQAYKKIEYRKNEILEALKND